MLDSSKHDITPAAIIDKIHKKEKDRWSRRLGTMLWNLRSERVKQHIKSI